MSKNSRVKFRLFVAWNIHTVIFLPISAFCLCNLRVVMSMHQHNIQCFSSFLYFKNGSEYLTRTTQDIFHLMIFLWNSLVSTYIGIMVRVFANGPGNLGSIPVGVIPKTQKWYLMSPCLTLSILRYGSRVKWSNPGKWVALYPTPGCSSYRKWSLRITLDYGYQLY